MSRRKAQQLRNEPKENSGFKPTKVVARSENQRDYIRTIIANDVTLCHGPPGAGKTFLAAALAVLALKQKKIEKVIISRPAVDSGASIGFLPGTMEEKMGPYMTPLFDELGYFLETKKLKELMEFKRLEIVPLSMMRGRTFLNAFVILDEAQNATFSELKMCLTRIGLNSKMVITGDLHQTDLHPQLAGGFNKVIALLRDLEGVGVCKLTAEDIVRHHLIARIEERLK